MDPQIRLLETPWESRNLQRPSYELELPKGVFPTPQDVADAVAALREQTDSIFCYARVPIDAPQQVATLSEAGFRLIETCLEPTVNTAKGWPQLDRFRADPAAFVPARYHSSTLEHRQIKDDAALRHVREIASQSFTQDRFHIDPQCDDACADARFGYWVGDLLQNSAVQCHGLHLQGELIGFMLTKRDHLVLAGFHPRHTRSGLADYLWLSVCDSLVQEGHRVLRTRISVNNLPVMNLYVRLGFKFRDPTYVLHYWSS